MKLLKNQRRSLPCVGDEIFGCRITAIKPCDHFRVCLQEYRGISCSGNFAIIKEQGGHVCAFHGSKLETSYKRKEV